MKLLVCFAHFTVVYVILIVTMPRSRQKIFYDFFLNVMCLTFKLKDDPFIFSESEKHRVIEPFHSKVSGVVFGQIYIVCFGVLAKIFTNPAKTMKICLRGSGNAIKAREL